MAILVGTASWTDPTLIKSGRFYPKHVTSPEERLRYYASEFPIVELDSSFYALPSFKNAVLWANRTPEHFTFDVKLFRLFTLHQTPLKSLPSKLREAAAPFANKRGNVYYPELPRALQDDVWTMSWRRSRR